MFDGEIPQPNSMLAYDAAIANGWLPAAVPISEPQTGKIGIATQAFVVEGNPRAEEMALSDDIRTRALAAIWACHNVRKSIKKHQNLATR